jgi:hypothetical protein
VLAVWKEPEKRRTLYVLPTAGIGFKKSLAMLHQDGRIVG